MRRKATRSPRPGGHRSRAKGTASNFNPGAEYEALTGRAAFQDWCAGAMAAAVRALDVWLAREYRRLLADFERSDPPLKRALASAPIARPLPGWVRTALIWWAHYKAAGGVEPEVERLAGVPDLTYLGELLAQPPLPRTRALFDAARAIRVGGQVVSSDLAVGLGPILLDPVVEVFRLEAASRGEVERAASLGAEDITLEEASAMIDVARNHVQEIRKLARRKRPRGATIDLAQDAFLRGVLLARRDLETTGRHVGLLAAAAGIERSRSRADIAKAAVRWQNRRKRMGEMRMPAQPRPLLLLPASADPGSIHMNPPGA